MPLIEDVLASGTNLFDFLVRGGLADTRRTPSTIIAEGPKQTVHRYTEQVPVEGPPVLLVPPLGAPAVCMDLRRGCSLAEHLVLSGRPTYLVDYGPMAFEDRAHGLEFWIRDVLPAAIRAVSEDRGGEPVQLVGWCLGGLFSLLTTAAFAELPVSAVAMIASPVDLSKVRLADPLRLLGKVTGGQVVGTALRTLGTVPANLVSLAFKTTALSTYLRKPLTVFKYSADRDALAHIEAVDDMMRNMYGYPGRAIAQAYHRLVRANELATGRVEGPTRTVHLSDVRVPVMNIAGDSDVLAPEAATHHVVRVLPNAPEVRLHTAPGGHLGVLTGRTAAETTWTYLDSFLDES
ncbi:alpha/beta fold hydrolase [Sciscionella marina]|uniref:alpha/beta fold hydrolase n=1 Tax=Sciscionella marina TaxID=508770 RepID=UPI00035C3D8E|nr:alpha/beta fold hydrolase [Sciscionella marina]